MDPYSVYLHIPFCRHRCGYCDFNTYAGLENLIPAYVKALCSEVDWIGAAAGSRLAVHTLFFGGGTPSLLPSAAIRQILVKLSDTFSFLPEIEITLEANPGTLTPAYLRELTDLGVNRLSLGVQSANPDELHLLERQHNYLDVIQSVAWARQAGFTNINLDLIFGLPYQSLESWQRTLDLALGLAPEHFSLYALTLEHGTPLEHWAKRGLIAEPDPDLAAEMYEWASEFLAQSEYTQYEISNWAKKRNDELLACQHNLQYWRGLPYLGLGAGAHGYAAGQRTANVLSPAAYIQRLSAPEKAAYSRDFPLTPATQNFVQIDRQAEIGEFMMMGLRLVDEGVPATRFEQRFGETLPERFGKQIDQLTRLGLLEWSGSNRDVLRLSKPGRLLGNRVFVEFI